MRNVTNTFIWCGGSRPRGPAQPCAKARRFSPFVQHPRERRRVVPSSIHKHDTYAMFRCGSAGRGRANLDGLVVVPLTHNSGPTALTEHKCWMSKTRGQQHGRARLPPRFQRVAPLPPTYLPYFSSSSAIIHACPSAPEAVGRAAASVASSVITKSTARSERPSSRGGGLMSPHKIRSFVSSSAGAHPCAAALSTTESLNVKAICGVAAGPAGDAGGGVCATGATSLSGAPRPISGTGGTTWTRPFHDGGGVVIKASPTPHVPRRARAGVPGTEQHNGRERRARACTAAARCSSAHPRAACSRRRRGHRLTRAYGQLRRHMYSQLSAVPAPRAAARRPPSQAESQPHYAPAVCHQSQL